MTDARKKLNVEQEGKTVAKLMVDMFEERSNYADLLPAKRKAGLLFSETGFMTLASVTQMAFKNPSYRVRSNGINMLDLLLHTQSGVKSTKTKNKLEELTHNMADMANCFPPDKLGMHHDEYTSNLALGVNEMLVFGKDNPGIFNNLRKTIQNLVYANENSEHYTPSSKETAVGMLLKVYQLNNQ